ncbi:MAG: DMT family transporter [Pyrinomonadaceae bacterium]
MTNQAATTATQRHGRDHAAAPHLALIAVQLIFGTWPIVAKYAFRSLTATQLVMFRVGGATLAFLFLRRVMGSIRITRKSDYLRLAVCSLLGVILNQLLFVKGLSLTTVINATLLGTTIPVFTLIVGIALGYERISLNKAAGILLAASGVIYLIDPFRADFSASTTLGNILLIANSIFFGAYIVVSKDLLKRYNTLTVITWVFIIGNLATVPLGILNFAENPVHQAGIGVWLAVLYIILVPTVGAYYLNGWALERVAPSTVAVYIYLQPLIAFALAPLLLGEAWNSRTWVASALIFTGVAFVTRRTGTRPHKEVIEEIADHPDALGH